MELSNYLLHQTAELIIDESPSVQQQAISTCLVDDEGQRDLLIHQMITVFKEKLESEDLNEENSYRERLETILSTLIKMHEKERFSVENVRKSLHFLFFDVFQKFENHEGEKSDSNKDTSMPESFKLFMSFVKTDLGQIPPIFLMDNSLNNFYAVKALNECLKADDYLFKKNLVPLLQSIQRLIQESDNENDIRETIADSLRIMMPMIKSLDEETKTACQMALTEIFRVFYENLFKNCFTNKLRAKVFDLSVDSFSKHKILEEKVVLENIRSISEQFLTYLFESEEETTSSAFILLAEFHHSFPKEKIFSSSLEKMSDSLFKFSDQHINEVMESESILGLAIFAEKEQSGLILDPSISKLKNPETSQTGCLFLYKLIKENIQISNDKIATICKSMNDICLKPGNISVIGRILLFKLWTALSHIRATTNDIKTSSVFQLISAPCMADYVPQLIDIIMEIAETSKIQHLLDSAVDPKFIIASPVAFACLAVAENSPSYTLEMSTIVPRAMVYAASPYFSPRTKSDIISVIGRINSVKDYSLTASRITSKNCQSASLKLISKFLLDLNDANMSNDAPTWWTSGAISFLEHFPLDLHPESNKTASTSSNPKVVSGKSNFPLSYIKSGVYVVVSILCSLPSMTTSIQTSFQPLLSKFDITNIAECQTMAFSLRTIYSYSAQFALDSYKSKTETRKFAPKDTAHVLPLEFCSRSLELDNRYETRVIDMLNDETVPNEIRSHVFRRLAKKCKIALNSGKANLLINEFLEDPNENTVKAGLSAFLVLVKRNQLQNFGDALSKAVNSYYTFPSMRPLATELFESTPLDLNFTNFCTVIFGSNSKDAMNFLSELVTKSENDNSKILSLKNAKTASACSLILLNPEFQEKARRIVEIIFNFRNIPEEFPLTFYCSSDTTTGDEFVANLLNWLKIPEPWSQNAMKAILLIAKDPRFDRVVPICVDEFLKNVSTVSKNRNLSQLALLLFNKDKFNFVNKLLTTRLITSTNQLTLFASIFEEIGQTVFVVAMKTLIADSITYFNVLKLLQTSKIPESLSVSSIVFIIYTFAQIISINFTQNFSSQTSLQSNQASDQLNVQNIYHLFDECEKSMEALSERFEVVHSSRVSKSLMEIKEFLFSDNKTINEKAKTNLDEKDILQFNFLRALFSICAKDIAMFHIQSFVSTSPVGALAGYSEIIHQGRPLIHEILQLGRTNSSPISNNNNSAKSSKKAALMTIPSLKQLPVDRYGEGQLSEMFEFVLESLSDSPKEAFNCVVELFEWLPKNVIFEKCGKMFYNTQKAIRKNPDFNGFAVMVKFADSLTFSSRQELKDNMPAFLTIAFAYSETENLAPAARKALITLCQFAAMPQTAISVQRNFTVPVSSNSYEFVKLVAKNFVNEMDVRCIESAFSLLDESSVSAKIALSFLLCAAINQKKGIEKNIHLRLNTVLNSANVEMKMGILKAIQTFPPILGC
ncbi:hypothetical protein TRFO_39772 [Tritrichomonas foetus]|uniref:Uncharacterized protein n=1 Tax=Tritrichomonas foetus TaxID=1144522 RepID=A0A1J4J8N8_9EUKA|nr:hypothetical protein TRFO_39772 [Tritrichomonas foetus]|eukprot:OHS94051.1 hypothetical protein TRFO_39772 [Tritrichomonas foetus]